MYILYIYSKSFSTQFIKIRAVQILVKKGLEGEGGEYKSLCVLT